MSQPASVGTMFRDICLWPAAVGMLATASSRNSVGGVSIIDGPKHGGSMVTGARSRYTLTW